ncbi:MAG: CinA family protein [Gammaproteobacteria bacterium]|nr:CinA family protein [Gammaproteobacteria bacterium]
MAGSDLQRLAGQVAERLRRSGARIVTAESCTGGLLAKVLTDLAGSSDYFDRGWVTYSNAAKQDLLGVGARLLARQGAVSREVALAMVRGALGTRGASCAVAVTGIAGPGGGVPDKPVGTVWIAWGWRERRRVGLVARRFRFRGDRAAVRQRSVAAALRGLLRNPAGTEQP